MGKIGENEIESMQNMMAMSVYFIIADTFDVDAMDIDADNDLQKDLHMTSEIKHELNESFMDMFNGHQLDFSKIHKVQDIVDQIVTVELNNSIH